VRNTNFLRESLITSLFKKSLSENLLRKGFIENGMTAWSSGATVGDKPANGFGQAFL
jgi:chemotaxis methyl-accepting protein methylase